MDKLRLLLHPVAHDAKELSNATVGSIVLEPGQIWASKLELGTAIQNAFPFRGGKEGPFLGTLGVS